MERKWPPMLLFDALDLSLPTTFGIATYPAGATFGPRQLRDWEFVWMIEGDAVYRRGERSAGVAAPAGSIVLCRPCPDTVRDFFRWDPERRTRHGYFHFQIETLPKSWPPPDEWPLVRIPNPDVDDDLLRPLFRHLLTTLPRPDADPLQKRLALSSLLAAFVTGDFGVGDVPRGPFPDAVERALAFVQNRLEAEPDTPIELAELAAVACVTPAHLCRQFRVATGRSPMETVRLARLDRAAVLLVRSNYAVAEIASLCGFASPFHFSRRFRDAFGQSPSEMRRAVRNGATPPSARLLQRSISVMFPATPAMNRAAAAPILSRKEPDDE